MLRLPFIPVDKCDDTRLVSEVDERVKAKKVRMSPEDRDCLLRYLTTANGR